MTLRRIPAPDSTDFHIIDSAYNKLTSAHRELDRAGLPTETSDALEEVEAAIDAWITDAFQGEKP